MKVKANYGISCEKGYFETGEVFEIDPQDLPTYGDAVTVLDKAPEAEPKEESDISGDAATEEATPDAPESEKLKATRPRTRVRKS